LNTVGLCILEKPGFHPLHMPSEAVSSFMGVLVSVDEFWVGREVYIVFCSFSDIVDPVSGVEGK